MIKLIKNALRSPLLFNSSLATVDQAILSGLNFVISIILIKTVSKVEFGYYSIALSIALFFLSIQGAIVNTPLAVLLVEKKGDQRQKYSGALCYGQFLVILPAAFLGLIASGLMYFWGFDTLKSILVASISLAAIGLAFREFLRAYYFAEETPLRVLKIDVIYILLYMSLIMSCHLFYKLSTSAVFILNGLSGFMVSVAFVRHRGWRFDRLAIKESYRENWGFGKWALLGAIVTHLQNYSFIYLIGALLGSAAVADVSAARLLMMPVLLAKIGWGKIVVPHGSKLRESNQKPRFFKEQAFACVIFIVCIGVYILGLLSFSGILNRFLCTEHYADSFKYLMYWGVFFIVAFFALSASYGLQVMKEFYVLTKVNIYTMLVTVAGTYFFIQWFGIKGGFAALIFGGALAAIAFWYLFVQIVFPKLDSHQTAPIKEILSHKPN
jgi:O-antigen/teichoic acid export membrane protein